MTLIKRMTRLFQADVHGILDQLEDPAAVLRQAVREMEAVVSENEGKLAMLEKRHQHLLSLQADTVSASAELESQVDLALHSGNEALCRALVRKKLEYENRGREIERAITRVTEAKTETLKQLADRRERLQAIIKKIEVVVPADDVMDPEATGDEDEFSFGRLERRFYAVTDEDVEVAMLKLKQVKNLERKD